MKIRTYTDVNGHSRRIAYMCDKNYSVQWHRKYGPSRAQLWKLEDGSTVQIPWNAWYALHIKFKDIYVN